MTRLARWPSLLLLLVLLAWLPELVPGYGVPSERGTSFTIGTLIRGVVDPLVVPIAIVAALVAGGWRGLRRGAAFLLRGDLKPRERDASATLEAEYSAASCALAAGGRGLLWGACVLNSIYVVSFYWPAGPGSAGLLGSFRRLDYVKYGALLAVTAGAFILIPAAEAPAERSGKRITRATRIARGADALALVGLLGCALTVLLSVFVYRAPVIGEVGSGRTFVLPSASGLDSSFALWSFAVVPIVAALAVLATPSPGSGGLDQSRSAELAGRFARALLAAGVLVATLVEIAGLKYIASTGGQGNPAEIEGLVGRMLVPVATGLLVGVCAQLLPAAAGWRLRPAPGSGAR